MSRNRVLLVRLSEDELRRVSSSGGGLMVQLVVTHANVKVSVEDDRGGRVEYRRAEVLQK